MSTRPGSVGRLGPRRRIDAADALYVSNSGPSQVLKLARDATSPTELPFTGLQTPQGVTVDSAGNIYVTDKRQHHSAVVRLAAP